MTKASAGLGVKFVELLGADFKKQFDLETYKTFFEDMGYKDVEYRVVDGRMPCAIAVIQRKDQWHYVLTSARDCCETRKCVRLMR